MNILVHEIGGKEKILTGRLPQGVKTTQGLGGVLQDGRVDISVSSPEKGDRLRLSGDRKKNRINKKLPNFKGSKCWQAFH